LLKSNLDNLKNAHSKSQLQQKNDVTHRGGIVGSGGKNGWKTEGIRGSKVRVISVSEEN